MNKKKTCNSNRWYSSRFLCNFKCFLAMNDELDSRKKIVCAILCRFIKKSTDLLMQVSYPYSRGLFEK